MKPARTVLESDPRVLYPAGVNVCKINLLFVKLMSYAKKIKAELSQSSYLTVLVTELLLLCRSQNHWCHN